MKVAIYYPWVYLRSGVERMILELMQRSRHDWTLFTSHYYPEQTFPEFRDVDMVELSKVSVSRGYTAVAGAALTILRQKMDLSDYRALVVSSEGLGDFITWRNHEIPVICYCHTPLKVIHDPFVRQRYLDENPQMKAPFTLFSGVFKFFDRLAWKNYHYVFCNSQEVRSRIIKARLAPPVNIEVLHPGMDSERMQPIGVYEKYFVVVGRIKWWKNIELAIEAFHDFKRRNPQFADFELRITGLVESGSEEYLAKLRQMAGGRGDISFIRNPDEEELMAAYRSSYALLFPSLNEDWGMTPLEAMAFGKPVIAVRQGGPTESVIDGQTGYLVSPDPASFADAMAIIAGDPELVRRMGEAAVEQVRKYDWKNFVGRFDAYLDELEAGRDRPCVGRR